MRTAAKLILEPIFEADFEECSYGFRPKRSAKDALKLIRMWLNAPVREEAKGKPPTQKRSKKGTPQGGVISPLSANLYLHWFDRKFHMASGPGQWADAQLVRYADDFVIMARYVETSLAAKSAGL